MGNIKLNDIKEQFILPALRNKGYRFKVYTNVGAYTKVLEEGNKRKGVINALIEVTESDVVYLGGGTLKACAADITLSFLVPAPDSVSAQSADGLGNEYGFLEDFRNMLADTFADVQKITINSEGKTYVGGVFSSFPSIGELAQRQILGTSVEYVCFLQFAYLAGAVNSSDVKFYLDEDPTAIPYTKFSIARKNTMTAALLSNSSNGEATAYAESASFVVDLFLPAIDPDASYSAKEIFEFLMGITSANKYHTLRIEYGSHTITRTVIFSETTNNGEGVENVSSHISFVPYMPAETRL